jgi:IclR family transcriptional regulator, acetate operon repressor
MSTIGRALAILEIVAGEPSGSRITDLATTLKLNRAIPHRLLAELMELGYVVQDPHTERYRATFRVGSLGLRQLETSGVQRWAKDDLAALAAESRELVRLSMVCGSELRFVAKAQGGDSALMVDDVSGSSVPLHSTASGKAWLSSLPDAEVRELLTQHGLESRTSHTETDLLRIIEEIGNAREVGFAVTYEENEIGINAIAVPVVPPEAVDGKGVGTISIAGPSVRLTRSLLPGYAPALRRAAVTLGRQWHVFEYLTALAERECR